MLNPFPLPVCDWEVGESRNLERDGFGVDSGNANSSGREMVSAWRMHWGNMMEGKVMSSWKTRYGELSTCSFKNGYIPQMTGHTSSLLS